MAAISGRQKWLWGGVIVAVALIVAILLSLDSGSKKAGPTLCKAESLHYSEGLHHDGIPVTLIALLVTNKGEKCVLPGMPQVTMGHAAHGNFVKVGPRSEVKKEPARGYQQVLGKGRTTNVALIVTTPSESCAPVRYDNEVVIRMSYQGESTTSSVKVEPFPYCTGGGKSYVTGYLDISGS